MPPLVILNEYVLVIYKKSLLGKANEGMFRFDNKTTIEELKALSGTKVEELQD